MADIRFRGTLQDIRLFVAAYEEGSFTAAGLRENTSQSGVSQHIRNLEDGYGVRLFVRERSSVVPTIAADAIYRRCLVILGELSETATELRQYSKMKAEQITIGVMPALSRRVVAATLQQFEKHHPNVKVKIVEGMSFQFPAMVKSQEIDFALGVELQPDRGIRTTPMASIPDCLMGRKSEEDRDCIMVQWPVDPLKIIWPSGGFSRRDALRANLCSLGLAIAQDRELDSAFVALDLVSRSEWMMTCPVILLDPQLDAENFAMRPLGPNMNFDISLIEEKVTPMTQAAMAFVAILRDHLEITVQSWQKRFADAGV